MRSDSLWGLICWGVRTLWSEEELLAMIEGYNSGAPLKVSSAFKWINTDSGLRRFFPKPLLPPFDLSDLLEGKPKSEKMKIFSNLKKWRSQKTVSEEVFFRFITGDLDEKGFFTDEALWASDSMKKRFRVETTIHNSINRLTASANKPVDPENPEQSEKGFGGPFTRENVFAKDAGLFFLIDGEPEYLEKAEAALRLYSHIGFMGDSSVGKSHFDIRFEDFAAPSVDNPSGFVTLSLFIPTEEEAAFFSAGVNNANEEGNNNGEPGAAPYYELETRKGKVSSAHLSTEDFWKKSVLAFREGSYFPGMKKNNYGTLKEVKQTGGESGFTVYQSGIAFNLPARLK
ncbi:MAG: hypothetical protein K8F28_12050 [Ignavibacteriaceae bacterium]|nr:hypothetical protein [Ignavibacteriaceae bacterium]